MDNLILVAVRRRVGATEVNVGMLTDGQRSPTLHIHPGDRLIVTLTNDTPAAAASSALQMQMSPSDPSEVCGAATALHLLRLV